MNVKLIQDGKIINIMACDDDFDLKSYPLEKGQSIDVYKPGEAFSPAASPSADNTIDPVMQAKQIEGLTSDVAKLKKDVAAMMPPVK